MFIKILISNYFFGIGHWHPAQFKGRRTAVDQEIRAIQQACIFDSEVIIRLQLAITQVSPPLLNATC
jgi:hypothetical protein